MDTIQEVVVAKPMASDPELLDAASGAAPNDTTKSSQDSSFSPYNCSSLLMEEEDDQQQQQQQQPAVEEIIEQHDGVSGEEVAVDADVVKVLNGAGTDGSDSGVEFGVTGSLNDTGILQRALSNNSAGYASSCCGLEEGNGVSVSCNSSMISYSSDVYDKTGSTILLGGGSRLSNDYCASEGGSESSSITGGPVSSLRKGGSSTKKKVAMKEPLSNRSPRKSAESICSARSSSRSRASSLGRSVSLNLKTPPTSAMNVAARERARSREKMAASTATKTVSTPKSNTLPAKRPPKPDSLPTGLKEASPALQRVTVSRTPSVTRGRTPLATPTDDGRWPSVGGKGTTTPRSTSARGTSAAPEGVSIKTRVGTLALEAKVSSPLDKFGTLPRRRKERSAEDLQGSSSRSASATRNQNPMTTSLIKKLPSTKQETPTRTLPSYPKLANTVKKAIQKTKIYHETSVQTAITCKDVEDAFNGKAKDIRVDAIEQCHKQTQSDIRDKEMERLEEKLKKLTAEYSTMLTKHSEKSQMVTALEQKLLKEREEKLAAQKELQMNSERVLGLLESVPGGVPVESTGSDCDSLLMLESQLQLSGSVLEKKQEEIAKLRTICRTLHADMELSLKNQEELLRQKTELEEESSEMQDFLQAEKASCVEALKEAELEMSQLRQTLALREGEIERQQEECRHLVRIGEQRRQEYLGMQAKYNALESRSKDILLQQGAAVSGASVALSGLGTRLDHLVEQLIASYNISEQDLEDVIYHNEAYTNSSSGDGSPECEQQPAAAYCDQQPAPCATPAKAPLSPQRGQSFIAAVISAIKNATSKSAAAGKSASVATPKERKEICGHESDSTEMLDSETEPCLMMDNVLEDVAMPDSHSHNMVSSSTRISQIEMPSSLESGAANAMISHDESLDNLSQAIANRQQIELQSSIIASGRSPRRQFRQSNGEQRPANAGTTTAGDHTTASHSSSLEDDENSCCGEASIAEMPSICEYCNAQSLVDQVIDVDNLITKLLKVLRIVQMDNDHCIQELVVHKNKLALTNEEIQDRAKEYEELNVKLKEDLADASQQLVARGNELTKSKAELVCHRQEIDKLNEDICQLSTLCSNNKQQQNANMLTINREDVISALKLWNENDSIPEKDLISHVVQACNEIPKLKARLCEKEQQLAAMQQTSATRLMSASWHQALGEAKRQYEAIDRALETLHSVQSIVQQSPALTELQRDLEETNFQSIPLVSLPAHLVNGNGVAAVAAAIDLNANQTSNGNGSPVAAVAGLQLTQPDFIDSTA
ncbi:cornetto [Culex quinquefasciatus]|uniref:Cornetto n=1 Tax=Culex quinquefasciatus TaxID=7176 RepID=B0W6W4_CULQU|nr:myosin-9 [Culex quinquefasciatus]EDS37110.1 cornetto [Culex quinquefasciatus]|eukprot:XP_001844448.1 cornetto [Culex quinquefasciatus]